MDNHHFTQKDDSTDADTPAPPASPEAPRRPTHRPRSKLTRRLIIFTLFSVFMSLLVLGSIVTVQWYRQMPELLPTQDRQDTEPSHKHHPFHKHHFKWKLKPSFKHILPPSPQSVG